LPLDKIPRSKSANFCGQCLTYPQKVETPLALAEMSRRTIGNEAFTSKSLILLNLLAGTINHSQTRR
jgi:hypothetical protein